MEFTLDEELLQTAEVVVFRGELRLRSRRCAANLIYPPSYAADGHPLVVAPELPVGRHKSPEGQLCLDHPVFGRTQPMSGAEAVARAERLWDLWVNDPEMLRVEEADAPDPAANYYVYAPGSAVTMIDANLGDGTRGFFDLAANSLVPLHGALTSVRVTHPAPVRISPPPGVAVLSGSIDLTGAWVRVSEPPPFTTLELRAWIDQHHKLFTDRQLDYAREQAKANRRPGTPALVAFVYPDEGPGRDETHDAWLFVAIDPDTGNGHLARSFHLRSDERWLRQPQLKALAGNRVAIIGAGALGSQIAGLLARAGIGRMLLADGDLVTHGNRVRHELDLTDIGRQKVDALQGRLLAVNPWIEVAPLYGRVGGATFGPAEGLGQRQDDIVFEGLQEMDLIVNATADAVAGNYISALGVEAGKPVLHVWVSAGAWGARLLIQRPGRSGCWSCLASFQEAGTLEQGRPLVPSIAEDPEVREVSERGCADPSFTGPGFELAAAASAASRIAVQLLLQDAGAYPPADFDLATLNFRDEIRARPSTEYSRLPVHPECLFCNPPGS
ncbi:MAG: HesA/MoeB/ThiF family protein [Terriglobales bacterium]